MYWQYMANSLYFDTSLIVQELPAIGDGSYRNTQWTDATRRKIEMIITILEHGIDDIFMFSDVDIQFFGPLTDIVTHCIKEHDIVTQKDPSKNYDLMHCTGFMAMRVTKENKRLFKQTLQRMIDDPASDDQDAFNEIVREGAWNIGTFDEDIVWSHRKMWRAGDDIDVPESVAVHHANWVYSVEDKLAQLEAVKNQYRERYGVIPVRQKIEKSKRVIKGSQEP